MFQSILLIIFGVYNAHASSMLPERDPCVVVCEDFSASRRGNGEFLCDTGTSKCVLSPWGSPLYYCLHLYWGATDDGQHGLIYEEDERQLTQYQLEHNYLTCSEARQLVEHLVQLPPPAQTDLSHAHAISQIIYRLRPVERMVALAANGGDRLTPAQMLERSEMVRLILNQRNSLPMSSDMPSSPYDMLETFLQSIDDPIRSIFEHQGAMIWSRCHNCGVSTLPLDHIGPIYRISVRLSQYRNELDMTRTLQEIFPPPTESMRVCGYCSDSNVMSTGRILTTLPEIFPIELRRQLYHFGPYMNTRVIFPQALDLSSIPGVAEMNTSRTHYTLVALTHSYANGSHSAELNYNHTWYRVDTLGHMQRLDEPTIGSSSTVSLLLYQRDDVRFF